METTDTNLISCKDGTSCLSLPEKVATVVCWGCCLLSPISGYVNWWLNHHRYQRENCDVITQTGIRTTRFQVFDRPMLIQYCDILAYFGIISHMQYRSSPSYLNYNLILFSTVNIRNALRTDIVTSNAILCGIKLNGMWLFYFDLAPRVTNSSHERRAVWCATTEAECGIQKSRGLGDRFDKRLLSRNGNDLEASYRSGSVLRSFQHALPGFRVGNCEDSVVASEPGHRSSPLDRSRGTPFRGRAHSSQHPFVPVGNYNRRLSKGA